MSQHNGHQVAPENGRGILQAICPHCPLATDIQALHRRMETLDGTKTDFIRIASHELRTPLAIIKGYASMMAGLCPPAAAGKGEVRLVLDGISSGITRLEELVNLLLAAAQVSQGALELEPRPCSMKVLIKEVAGLWQEALAERNLGLDIVFDVPQNDRVMWPVDPAYVAMAWHHLLQNAIKFTPDGGTITLRLSRPAKDRLQLEIIDTGIGVAAQQRELIFEKFYRAGDVQLHSTGKTKFMGAGPGLGLYLVRGIVEAHHGQVWVESNNGQPGSRFVVHLPEITQLERGPYALDGN